VELGEVPASAVATLSVELDPREGWQEIEEEALVDTGDAGSGVVYVNKDACRDGFCAHVYALVMGGPVESLEEYHQRFRREIADAADAELLVEEGVEVDGHPGYQVEYRLGGERDLRSLQRHAVVDGEAVVVTFTALAPMFEQWRADAEAMLDSVAVVSRG
jgi:hypothetical protein